MFFLVSRNQYLDYRTGVAPNFMCEARASSILAKVAEKDVTELAVALLWDEKLSASLFILQNNLYEEGLLWHYPVIRPQSNYG